MYLMHLNFTPTTCVTSSSLCTNDTFYYQQLYESVLVRYVIFILPPNTQVQSCIKCVPRLRYKLQSLSSFIPNFTPSNTYLLCTCPFYVH